MMRTPAEAVSVLLGLTALLSGCTSEDRSQLTASGTLEAIEITISSKSAGEAVSVRVDEGSEVRPGDTLVIIDHLDLDIQLKQAEANVAVAAAQWKLSVKGARREDIFQADASLENAKDDWARMEQLYEAKSVTRKQYDDAKTRLTLAEQSYDKLKSGSRSEEIEITRARRDQAMAQAEGIRKKINDCTVTAPTTGTVTVRSVEPGESVLPNFPLLILTQLDKVHLMIYVPETDLPRLQINQSAGIFIDGEPGKRFEGRISYISPVAEFTPRNIQTKEERTKLVFGVKIAADNPGHVLKAGMPADATVDFQESGTQEK